MENEIKRGKIVDLAHPDLLNRLNPAPSPLGKLMEEVDNLCREIKQVDTITEGKVRNGS